MRKALAVALSIAVQTAALGAPLVHVHPDDHPTAHHGGVAVHTHWSGHTHSSAPPDTPAIDAADHDRAVFTNTFVAVTTTALLKAAVTSPVFALPMAVEAPAHGRLDDTRSHDPPFIRSCSSRAPPFFLS
ncbi:MAG: hypothetical protein ACRD3G_19520 [Vicinamibacterales bacterium]